MSLYHRSFLCYSKGNAECCVVRASDYPMHLNSFIKATCAPTHSDPDSQEAETGVEASLGHTEHGSVSEILRKRLTY